MALPPCHARPEPCNGAVRLALAMRPLVLVVAVCSAAVSAQNIAWSPSAFANVEGNANNTIPFWSTSSTYQQVHDYGNMRGTLPVPLPLNGIALRKDGALSGSITGRTMDVQMVVGTTPIDSQSASSTFATNLGPNPVTVLAWTQVSMPNLSNVSLPNPAGLIVPWTMPFVYVPVPGMHLCWEWRHRNASTNASAAMDASTGTSATAHPNEGAGCQVAGQTRPASITSRSLSFTTNTYVNRLSYATANAAGVFALGLQRTNLQLPGMCSALLTLPAFTTAGVVDSGGIWNLQLTGLALGSVAQAELLGQFVWLDPSFGLGIGLSDMSVLETPPRSARQMARLYAAPSRGGAGYENATSATGITRGYGLVTGFVTP